MTKTKKSTESIHVLAIAGATAGLIVISLLISLGKAIQQEQNKAGAEIRQELEAVEAAREEYERARDERLKREQQNQN